MKSILITGCNRGLGLGLVRQLLKSPKCPNQVIATCRDEEKAKELVVLAQEHPQTLKILKLDVTKHETYDDFVKQVQNILGVNQGLNVLFNNAGYSPKFTRLQLVKAEHILETFQINAVAPIMLTKALLPLLKKSADDNSSQPLGPNKALVVNMTSMLGSVAMNSDGGLYPYRCSKTALNMATKSMSIDLKKDGIMAVCVHPGWVKTDMGGKNAPLEIEDSTSSIIGLVQNLNENHNGKFVQFNGEELPW